MITPAILTISAAMLLPSPTGDCVFGRMGDPTADAQAVAAFTAAVQDYAAVQLRLKRTGTPFTCITNPEQAEVAAEELRGLLGDARLTAVRGRFFTPAVADVLRFRIRAAWPLLTPLPALPPGLEYRVVGRDLVLRDVEADLVLDVLELALPITAMLPRSHAPEAYEETAPGDGDELVVPLDDEFSGCLEDTL